MGLEGDFAFPAGSEGIEALFQLGKEIAFGSLGHRSPESAFGFGFPAGLADPHPAAGRALPGAPFVVFDPHEDPLIAARAAALSAGAGLFRQVGALEVVFFRPSRLFSFFAFAAAAAEADLSTRGRRLELPHVPKMVLAALLLAAPFAGAGFVALAVDQWHPWAPRVAHLRLHLAAARPLALPPLLAAAFRHEAPIVPIVEANGAAILPQKPMA